MSAIEIIHEQVVGFNEQGQSALRDQYFIKLGLDFERCIASFKEVQLKFFFQLALHEAKIQLRGDMPLTIREVSSATRTSLRASKSAAYFLLKHNFIVKAGVRSNDQPDRGAIMYRVSAFAWFGNGNRPPTTSGVQNLHTLNNSSPVQNLHTPTPVQNDARGVQNSRAGVQISAGEVCKKPRGRVQKGARPVQKTDKDIVIDIDPNNLLGNQKEKQARRAQTIQPHLDADAQKARDEFRSFGIGGINLNKLAQSVSSLIASEWALCARHTDIPREMYQGICYNSLMADPTAPPPCSPQDLADWRADEQRALERAAADAEYERRVADGEIQPGPEPTPRDSEIAVPRDLRAEEIWDAALAELQLQMTKATFDTWIKSGFAISYAESDALLVVGVRNAYAKQWLENRLYGIVERAVNHAVGSPTTIMFTLRTPTNGV